MGGAVFRVPADERPAEPVAFPPSAAAGETGVWPTDPLLGEPEPEPVLDPEGDPAELPLEEVKLDADPPPEDVLAGPEEGELLAIEGALLGATGGDCAADGGDCGAAGVDDGVGAGRLLGCEPALRL